EDLVAAEAGDAEREAGRRARAAAESGEDPGEPRIERVLELRQREVGDRNLSDSGDDDESLTRHVERVGALGVPGDDQDEAVAGAEPVVGIDRPEQIRIELRGRAA